MDRFPPFYRLNLPVLMDPQKVGNYVFLSFRRKPESSLFKTSWTPASADVTMGGTFYESIDFRL